MTPPSPNKPLRKTKKETKKKNLYRLQYFKIHNYRHNNKQVLHLSLTNNKNKQKNPEQAKVHYWYCDSGADIITERQKHENNRKSVWLLISWCGCSVQEGSTLFPKLTHFLPKPWASIKRSGPTSKFHAISLYQCIIISIIIVLYTTNVQLFKVINL